MMTQDKSLENYQLVTIFRAGTLPKRAETVVENLLEGLQGKVEAVEHFGERDLVNPIKKEEKGVYARFNIILTKKVIPELEENLKLEKDILRTMLVRN